MSRDVDNRTSQLIELVLTSHDYDLSFIKTFPFPVFKSKKTKRFVVADTAYLESKVIVTYYDDSDLLIKRTSHREVKNAAKAIIKFLEKD